MAMMMMMIIMIIMIMSMLMMLMRMLCDVGYWVPSVSGQNRSDDSGRSWGKLALAIIIHIIQRMEWGEGEERNKT